MLLAVAFGWPSMPIIIGMFGPVMSASSSPTEAPAWARATARLTLTVLLPTPPLPEATAMTFLTPGRSCSAWRGCARRTIAPQVISTVSAPIAVSTALALPSISSLSGQAGVVSSIVKAIAAPSMATSLTISRVTMSRPSSGSWTARSASMTALSVRVGMSGGSLWVVVAGSVLTVVASISYRASHRDRVGRPGVDPRASASAW